MESRSNNDAETKDLPTTSTTQPRRHRQQQLVPFQRHRAANAPNASASDAKAPWKFAIWPEVVGFAHFIVPMLKERPSVTAIKALKAYEKKGTSTSRPADEYRRINTVHLGNQPLTITHPQALQPIPLGFHQPGQSMPAQYPQYPQGQQMPDYNQQEQYVQEQQTQQFYGPPQVQPFEGQYEPVPQMPAQYAPEQYQPLPQQQVVVYLPVQQPQLQDHDQQMQGYYAPGQYVPAQHEHYAPPDVQPLEGQYPPYQQAGYLPEQQPQFQQGQVQQPSGYYMQPQYIEAQSNPAPFHHDQFMQAQNERMYYPQNTSQSTFNKRLTNPRRRNALKSAHRSPPKNLATTTPAETNPAKDIPTKKSQAKEISATVIPAEISPAKKTPVKITPVQDISAKTTPVKKTSARDISTTVIPAKYLSAKTTPVKSTPAKKTPAKTTPAKTTPAKTTPVKTTPAKTTPAKTTPAKTTPVKTTPAMTTPAMTTLATPSKKTAAKRLQVRGIPAEDRSAEVIPANDIPVSVPSAKLQRSFANVLSQNTSVPERSSRVKCIPPSPQATLPTVEELDLDALFIGDDPVDLPGLGTVTRSEYEKDKGRYRKALFDHQQTVLASIKSKSGLAKTTEDEFQMVAKHKSFDQARLTEKQQEALKSIEQEMRRAKRTAHAMKRPDLDKDVTSEEPCCSTSVQPATSETSGETTLKTTQKPKSKGKSKEKTVVADDDTEVFKQASTFNMGLRLDAYFKERRLFLRENYIPPADDSALFSFENMLLNNARNSCEFLNDDDRSVKNNFIESALTFLETIGKMEGQEKVARFFNILKSRNDDILIIDCVAIQKAVVENVDKMGDYLLMYYVLCNNHDLPIPSTEDESHLVVEEAPLDEGESEWMKMVNTLHEYYQMRLEMLRTQFVPPDQDNESEQYQMEKTLINSARDHPDNISNASVKFQKVFCSVVLAKIKDWDISDQQRNALQEFYSYLEGRSDDIFLLDSKVLNTMMKNDKSRSQHIFWTYLRICMRNEISLPITDE